VLCRRQPLRHDLGDQLHCRSLVGTRSFTNNPASNWPTGGTARERTAQSDLAGGGQPRSAPTTSGYFAYPPRLRATRSHIGGSKGPVRLNPQPPPTRVARPPRVKHGHGLSAPARSTPATVSMAATCPLAVRAPQQPLSTTSAVGPTLRAVVSTLLEQGSAARHPPLQARPVARPPAPQPP